MSDRGNNPTPEPLNTCPKCGMTFGETTDRECPRCIANLVASTEQVVPLERDLIREHYPDSYRSLVEQGADANRWRRAWIILENL